MRHKVYGKHLNRDKDERTALFKNLVQSLILTEQIQTTEAKAKAIRGLVDKLVNKAKTPDAKRFIDQFTNKKDVGEKLIKEIAPRFNDRNSGYTSLVKIGRRLGDGAMLVRMSFVGEAKKAETKKADAKVAKKEKTEEAVEVQEPKKEEKK